MINRDFRVAEITREKIKYEDPAFETKKGVASFYREAVNLTFQYNKTLKKDEKGLSAGKVNASAVLHYVYQTVLTFLLKGGNEDFFTRRIKTVESSSDLTSALSFYTNTFPTKLEKENLEKEEELRAYFIHQVMLQNPALVSATKPFVSPEGIIYPESTKALSSVLSSFVKDELRSGELDTEDFFTLLCMPALLYPNSLKEQLMYILREWNYMLDEDFIALLKSSIDFINEEEKDRRGGLGPGPTSVTDYSSLENDYEAFSEDSDWMPKVVMIAKSALVWLDQLSRSYNRPITRLDQIPDEELDTLRGRGINALWLIGIWKRSEASKKIKHLCGSKDAVASAYSLVDYDISDEIGGWEALGRLKEKCSQRGIRLASDMVPNHVGLDGKWLFEHPEYFISQNYPPFPTYTYNGEDLSSNPDWEVKIEDHYYNQSDAAVTFRMRNRHTGETRYVFHGNDGTSMPWNDTAQLDYLNKNTREAVIQKILQIAKTFPIIRFDAAMTLAKKSIERLWYPKPGQGGDIAGRSEHAMDEKEFHKRIPEEFWREVVDRVQKEVPDTLLLAEAFWMMEGYFVRTLGMHRVYNSAFMNMLKNGENSKYRDSIKATLQFEPEILKRYVNFMNNPDEDTAILQFGDGDRYFATATLLATLPGLPMIGHGQIEGFKEKYGMDFQRAHFDEKPNEWLVKEHERKIFPLFRRRYLFANVDLFNLYDCFNNGKIEESVFAFVNGNGSERALVLVNNRYERCSGNINISVPKKIKKEDKTSLVSTRLAENLNLTYGAKRYTIMENFPTSLFYIYPSISLFDGFSFSLNGYETKIYWNIREVEDVDGLYERLCKKYEGKGIKNINKALTLLRLEPFYALVEKLREKSVISLFSSLIKGELEKEEEKKLLLSIAEVYALLDESYDSFSESVKGQLKKRPVTIEAKDAINIVKKLSKCAQPNGSNFFNYWKGVEPSLPVVASIVALLSPFTKDDTIQEVMEIADRMMLENFFEEAFKECGIYNEDEMRVMTHLGALISCLIRRFNSAEKFDTTKEIKDLFHDAAVLDLIGAHKEGENVWYNKERMQKTLCSTILSFVLSNTGTIKNGDVISSALLKKELDSEYKLNVFLSTL